MQKYNLTFKVPDNTPPYIFLSQEEEEKINPVVDVVSHAIKHLKPKGLFMQGVTDKETPKQS